MPFFDWFTKFCQGIPAEPHEEKITANGVKNFKHHVPPALEDPSTPPRVAALVRHSTPRRPSISAAEMANWDFLVTLHGGSLSRSFAKVGWMNTYAIISSGAAEVGKTELGKGTHKTPQWEKSHTFTASTLPQLLMIEVWDKNNFHRDVFCGSVTIPCDPGMGILEGKNFALTKKGRPTGTVALSFKVVDRQTGKVPEQLLRPESTLGQLASLGADIDEVLTWASTPKRQGEHQMQLKEDIQSSPRKGAMQMLEEAPDEEEQPSMVRVETNGGGKAAVLMGTWKCTDTFGLEEFLKASGVGVFQRKIAMAAKWPAWDFSNEGDHILFINHSAIGDLREQIPLGREYAWKDGHKNDYICTASWEAAAAGGTLKIDRKGKIGDYVEQRTVQGDRLEFVLTHSNGVKWGRTFERDSAL